MNEQTIRTMADVQAWLDRIKACAADDERAHSEEDALHQAVLASIARGECEDPVGCAALALTSGEINFARWCA